MTPSRITSEPGTIRAATSGNAAEDGSAGTTIGCGTSSGWPISVMRRPCCPRLDPHLGAEMAQHLLGMIARRLAFDHHGCARRGEPGQQRCRLELGRRHRGFEHDGDRVMGAGQRQRQPAVGRGQRAGADALQRLEHPPHRPLAQRRVAVEGRRDRASRNRAKHQPAPGSRIAEIERLRRLGEARDADAVNPPCPPPDALHRGAERAQRLARY